MAALDRFFSLYAGVNAFTQLVGARPYAADARRSQRRSGVVYLAGCVGLSGYKANRLLSAANGHSWDRDQTAGFAKLI
jgi:hypothetical protein